jgi:Na+-translocating ferredoxin:NAD+ oxidoreductase subunit G
MREMIKMAVVLTVLCFISGGLLAAIRNGTNDKIEYQELKFVKGPAILDILAGASNNPLEDRFKIMDGDVERSFFVGLFDDRDTAMIAFESSGKGYGGDIGVMAGVTLGDDKISGVGVTTHSETPGVGSRAKTEPGFAAQFRGLDTNQVFKVKGDGGQVDALSGATITSRGVAAAMTDAGAVYNRLKPQLMAKLNEIRDKR